MPLANEYRIGNWLRHYDDTLCMTLEVHPVSMYVEDMHGGRFLAKASELKGIELSPEWLEVCGFEKDRNGWFMFGKRFSLTEKFYPCWLDRMLWPQDIPDYKRMSLQYVHQLQNLYFALTGEELTSCDLLSKITGATKTPAP